MLDIFQSFQIRHRLLVSNESQAVISESSIYDGTPNFFVGRSSIVRALTTHQRHVIISLAFVTYITECIARPTSERCLRNFGQMHLDNEDYDLASDFFSQLEEAQPMTYCGNEMKPTIAHLHSMPSTIKALTDF